jgi:hypothetical protein
MDKCEYHVNSWVSPRRGEMDCNSCGYDGRDNAPCKNGDLTNCPYLDHIEEVISELTVEAERLEDQEEIQNSLAEREAKAKETRQDINKLEETIANLK